jgi:hypothetical protein
LVCHGFHHPLPHLRAASDGALRAAAPKGTTTALETVGRCTISLRCPELAKLRRHGAEGLGLVSHDLAQSISLGRKGCLRRSLPFELSLEVLSGLLDAQLRPLEDRVALDGRRSGGGGSGGGSLFSRLRTMTQLSELFIDLRR